MLEGSLFLEMVPKCILLFYLICYAGLGKKIDALGKKSDCQDVSEWRKSIVNHMYWCAASTPDGDGEVMKAKWQIVALHAQNIHKNPNSALYPECGHGILEGDSSDRLWLERGLQQTSHMATTVGHLNSHLSSLIFRFFLSCKL